MLASLAEEYEFTFPPPACQFYSYVNHNIFKLENKSYNIRLIIYIDTE